MTIVYHSSAIYRHPTDHSPVIPAILTLIHPPVGQAITSSIQAAGRVEMRIAYLHAATSLITKQLLTHKPLWKAPHCAQPRLATPSSQPVFKHTETGPLSSSSGVCKRGGSSSAPLQTKRTKELNVGTSSTSPLRAKRGLGGGQGEGGVKRRVEKRRREWRGRLLRQTDRL